MSEHEAIDLDCAEGEPPVLPERFRREAHGVRIARDSGQYHLLVAAVGEEDVLQRQAVTGDSAQRAHPVMSPKQGAVFNVVGGLGRRRGGRQRGAIVIGGDLVALGRVERGFLQSVVVPGSAGSGGNIGEEKGLQLRGEVMALMERRMIWRPRPLKRPVHPLEEVADIPPRWEPVASTIQALGLVARPAAGVGPHEVEAGLPETQHHLERLAYPLQEDKHRGDVDYDVRVAHARGATVTLPSPMRIANLRQGANRAAQVLRAHVVGRPRQRDLRHAHPLRARAILRAELEVPSRLVVQAWGMHLLNLRATHRG
mmetsp:Transcript_38535/g.110627  ORF Transcript_38535/g.110627 Transcript_38535/m.110627 type:complete len:313 (+) Transcript_38535:396-1334(+)